VPTYAYACTACEHRFEVQQAFSDASLTDCPECTGRLRKLFNSVGIVFKGSGFYRTDSRPKNGSSESSSVSSPSTTASTAAGETKSSDSSSSSSSTSSSGSSGGSSSGGSSSGGSSSGGSSKPATTTAA